MFYNRVVSFFKEFKKKKNFGVEGEEEKALKNEWKKILKFSLTMWENVYAAKFGVAAAAKLNTKLKLKAEQTVFINKIRDLTQSVAEQSQTIAELQRELDAAKAGNTSTFIAAKAAIQAEVEASKAKKDAKAIATGEV